MHNPGFNDQHTGDVRFETLQEPSIKDGQTLITSHLRRPAQLPTKLQSTSSIVTLTMAIIPRSGGVGKAFTAANAVTKSVSLGTAVAIPLVIAFAVILAIITFTICRRRKNKAKKTKQEQDEAYNALTATQSRQATSDRCWESDSDAEKSSYSKQR